MIVGYLKLFRAEAYILNSRKTETLELKIAFQPELEPKKPHLKALLDTGFNQNLVANSAIRLSIYTLR
jgi:hypothetical protein